MNFEVAYSRQHHGESCPIEVAEKLEELSRLMLMHLCKLVRKSLYK